MTFRKIRRRKKGIEASYMVSYRVAWTGKAHTTVVDLILPAAVNMSGIMLGENIQNNFIKQHCFTTHQRHARRCFETITASHTSQWILCITADESTDVAGPAQFLVYVRYVHGWSIKEDILFCKPLETGTTWENIFKVLDSFVTWNGLWWSRYVGICTDGAKAMTGRHSGVVTRVQAVAPDATWVHCSIPREDLAVRRWV